MRKIFGTIAIASMLSLSAMSIANAAPVAGYETQYQAVLDGCAAPSDACTALIGAYSTALVGGGVDVTAASASLVALRDTLIARDPAFAAVFAELFPDLQAIGGPVSPV